MCTRKHQNPSTRSLTVFQGRRLNDLKNTVSTRVSAPKIPPTIQSSEVKSTMPTSGIRSTTNGGARVLMCLFKNNIPAAGARCTPSFVLFSAKRSRTILCIRFLLALIKTWQFLSFLFFSVVCSFNATSLFCRLKLSDFFPTINKQMLFFVICCRGCLLFLHKKSQLPPRSILNIHQGKQTNSDSMSSELKP